MPIEMGSKKRNQLCVWKDVSRGEVDRLRRAGSAEDVRRVLRGLLSPEESSCPLRASALLDLYYYTSCFCRDSGLSAEQTSCLLSIIRETHVACAETSLGNVKECYQYFKELLLCHAVHRPPLSTEVFSQSQLLLIADYLLKTYFQHFKLYKLLFTPQVYLDLAVSYDDEESQSAAQDGETDEVTDEQSGPAAEDDGKSQEGPPPERLGQHAHQEATNVNE